MIYEDFLHEEKDQECSFYLNDRFLVVFIELLQAHFNKGTELKLDNSGDRLTELRFLFFFWSKYRIYNL